MYTSVYVNVFVYSHTLINYVNTYTGIMYMFTHVYMYTFCYMNVCIYTYIFPLRRYKYLHTHHVHTVIHTCTRRYMNMCIHTNMCKYTCIFLLNICRYIHTQLYASACMIWRICGGSDSWLPGSTCRQSAILLHVKKFKFNVEKRNVGLAAIWRLPANIVYIYIYMYTFIYIYTCTHVCIFVHIYSWFAAICRLPTCRKMKKFRTY